MSKLVSLFAALTVLLLGGFVLDQGAFAADPDEPALVEAPETSYLFGARYVEVRKELFLSRRGPIKPPPGVKPVDPNTGEARTTADMASMSRGGATVLSPGGGSGFSLGAGSSGPAATDRSPGATLSALAGANRALGY
jgi:hypothetical protein